MTVKTDSSFTTKFTEAARGPAQITTALSLGAGLVMGAMSMVHSQGYHSSFEYGEAGALGGVMLGAGLSSVWYLCAALKQAAYNRNMPKAAGAAVGGVLLAGAFGAASYEAIDILFVKRQVVPEFSSNADHVCPSDKPNALVIKGNNSVATVCQP